MSREERAQGLPGAEPEAAGERPEITCDTDLGPLLEGRSDGVTSRPYDALAYPGAVELDGWHR